MGGLTYSEMRSAYEISAVNNKWDVFIGSDHIVTPKQFLKDLEFNSSNQVVAEVAPLPFEAEKLIINSTDIEMEIIVQTSSNE